MSFYPKNNNKNINITETGGNTIQLIIATRKSHKEKNNTATIISDIVKCAINRTKEENQLFGYLKSDARSIFQSKLRREPTQKNNVFHSDSVI
jgi:hypothetical protein